MVCRPKTFSRNRLPPLREGEGVVPLPGEVPHQVKIVARVPWDKLSDFMSGVLLPLRNVGAEVTLKVELMAQSQEPIGPGVLDLKVRETLRQIGAATEIFEVS